MKQRGISEGVAAEILRFAEDDPPTPISAWDARRGSKQKKNGPAVVVGSRPVGLAWEVE